jgi:WD40 repeat protein
MWLAWTGCLALLLIGTAATDLATQYHSTSTVLVFGLVASTSGLVAQLIVGPGNTSPRRRTWDARRPPYPGLEPFSVDDADVFFGREAETSEIFDRIQPWGGVPQRFVPVVGPSGSGKSSLVQAGLVARLARSRRVWRVVPPVVPGVHPLKNLALALAEVPAAPNADEIAVGLGTGVGYLADLLDATSPQRRGHTLIVIDQLEELLTLASDAEREAFLGLINGVLDAVPTLRVVATLRSEFLTDLLSGRFAHLFRRPVIIGTLDELSVIRAVEEPAALAGMQFEPGVVSRMVTDAAGGQALPLLAYVLHELYDRTRGRGVVAEEIYQQLGGVRGALAKQADRVTAELSATFDEDTILRTLLKFVTLEGPQPTRRRVRRGELDLTEQRIVAAFIDARLLTSTTTEGDAVVDVAHEALFEYWPPLRQQVATNSEDLRHRTQLEHWVLDWEQSGRQHAFLLSGERLQTVIQWLPGLAKSGSFARIQEFIDISRREDRAWQERISDAVATQVLRSVDLDPEQGILLALAAIDECGVRPLAFTALHVALKSSHLRGLLRGHRDWVSGVAWSPDGGRIVTSSHDLMLRVWDAQSFETRVELSGHTDRVAAVAWSPDGHRITSSSHDRTIRIWDADTGTELRVLQGHEHRVEAVAWSPDGTRIASGSRDGGIRLWDAQTGQQLAEFTGHEDWVQSVSWSPDGTILASGSGDHTVRLWDETGASLGVLRGHGDWVEGLCWSPDGRQLVTGSRDRTVRLWDVARQAQRIVFTGHEDYVWGVAWSPDGDHIVSTSRDGTARVWSSQNEASVAVLRGHQDWVTAAAWSPDGQRVATAGRDTTVRIWDPTPSQADVEFRGHRDWVRALAWSPAGDRIATGSRDCTVQIWDAASSAVLVAFSGHTAPVRGVCWSPDGRWIASCSEDRTVRIWDSETGEEREVLTGHQDAVRSVAWHPSGDRLVAGARDGSLLLWDPVSGSAAPQALVGHVENTRSLCWSPDGALLASGSNDRSIRIWDASRRECLHVLDGHTESVNGLAWSPDGTRLVSGSRDRTIRLWDPVRGRQTGTVGDDGEVVRDVAWSPDGARIAAAYDDGNACVWDCEANVALAILAEHRAWAERIEWAPDGRLATSSGDGTARVWTVPSTIEELMDLARSRAFRTLSDEERYRFLLPMTNESARS